MNNNNFVATVILSIMILVGFHYLYEKPQADLLQKKQIAAQLEAETQKITQSSDADAIKQAPSSPPTSLLRDRDLILKETPRLPIITDELSGSINLKGGLLDDLKLLQYKETVEPESPNITLLSPSGSEAPHKALYARFGWLGTKGSTPDTSTVWTTSSKKLTIASPVVLTWANGQGLLFKRTFSVDEHFLFTVKDEVTNQGTADVTLYPFGAIARQGLPSDFQDIYVLHEGLLGVMGGTLKEIDYKDLIEVKTQVEESTGGWLGFTDKYWLTAMMPAQTEKITARFTYNRAGQEKPEDGIFQTDYRGEAIILAPGATTTTTKNLFAGAKRVRLIDSYADLLNLPHFDRAIDFGWYYFLTKPFLYFLDILGETTGNYGWAILIFTLLLKAATFPLSMKSYRSMARMKEIQPEIKRLQERYKEDRQQLGIATMDLYKREKINPMSGCAPMIIQIPIFFALYKVLYVGIEIRHEPLFGWIHDLSAPDPTSVLSLFGTIEWSWIPHLGVWPILMGISMFVQQSLSPKPADSSQAAAFKFLPIIFTFMMSKVAAGLIFYWTLSNVLGLAQQWAIMHKMKKQH